VKLRIIVHINRVSIVSNIQAVIGIDYAIGKNKLIKPNGELNLMREFQLIIAELYSKRYQPYSIPVPNATTSVPVRLSALTRHNNTITTTLTFNSQCIMIFVSR